MRKEIIFKKKNYNKLLKKYLNKSNRIFLIILI